MWGGKQKKPTGKISGPFIHANMNVKGQKKK